MSTLPEHLTVFEGDLFDTRKPNWAAHPVRKSYSGANREIDTTAQLKAALRSPYAWPGGYEIVFQTSDGALLCQQCVIGNLRSVLSSVATKHSDGWRVIACGHEATSAECARECSEDLVSHCDHCSREFGEIA
jgi:hypothetical protein